MTIIEHVSHPFHFKHQNKLYELSFEQKLSAIAIAAIFGFILLSPFIFYGITAYFKNRRIEDLSLVELKPSVQKTCKVVHQKFNPVIPVETQNISSNNKSSPAFSEKEVENSKKKPTNTAFKDSDFDPDILKQIKRSNETDALKELIKDALNDPNANYSSLKSLLGPLAIEAAVLDNLSNISSVLEEVYKEINEPKIKLKFIQLLPESFQTQFFNPFLENYFFIRTTKDDGNCWLYALIQGINPELTQSGSEQFAPRLRKHLQRYLKENQDKYKSFTNDFEFYLNQLSQDGTWGGDLEFRAFAEMTKIPVIVYDPAHVALDDDDQLHPTEDCYFKPTEEINMKPPIYLYHKAGNHYELLIKKPDMVIPPPIKINNPFF